MYVDGIVGDIGHGVLRDRRVLAEEGVVVVIVTIDTQTGEIVTGPEIVTRGWVYAPEAEDLLEDAKQVVRDVARSGGARGRAPTSRRCAATPAARSAGSSTSARAAARSSSRSSWKSDGVRARGWTRHRSHGPARARDRRRQRRRRGDLPRARRRGRVRVGQRHLRGPRGRRSRRSSAATTHARPVKADVTSPLEDRAHARGDRARSTSSSTTPAIPTQGFDAEAVRRHRTPRTGKTLMRLNLGAVLHVTHAYLGAMVDAGLGPDRDDRVRRGPQGRALPGDLRRGQGRRDGVHPRPRGRGRPRTASPRTASRSARCGPGLTEAAIERDPELERRLGRGLHRCRGSASPADAPPLVRCCAATPAPGSPARCTRSTAATSPRSVATPAGAVERPARPTTMPVDPVVARVAGVTVVGLWQPRRRSTASAPA